MAPGFGVFSVAMRDFAQNTPRCEWTLAKPKALETCNFTLKIKCWIWEIKCWI